MAAARSTERMIGLSLPVVPFGLAVLSLRSCPCVKRAMSRWTEAKDTQQDSVKNVQDTGPFAACFQHCKMQALPP